MIYTIPITLEKLDDDSGYAYMATSPVLTNLIVVGDTLDEVVSLLPKVSAELIASLQYHGDPLPEGLDPNVHTFPINLNIPVTI